MLTVTKTSVRRDERALVAQPYGEHRESAGSWPGRGWLAGGDDLGEVRAAAQDESPRWK